MELAADNLKQKPANFIDDIIEELKIAYKEDSKPWVVGFSGGKDTTALAQFIFYMLMELPKKKGTKRFLLLPRILLSRCLRLRIG